MKKPKMKITHENGQEFIRPVTSISWLNNGSSEDLLIVIVDFMDNGIGDMPFHERGGKLVSGLFTGELILT